jgi:hypothetical protein
MAKYLEDIRLLGGTVSIGSMTSSNINNLFEVNGNSAVYGTSSTIGLDVNGTTIHRDNVQIVNGKEIFWSNTNGIWPTPLANRIRWTLNNDSAQIYAFQPLSDDIDFVFKMTDNANTSADNYVFWIDDGVGEQNDAYPLEMNAFQFIVNPLRRYAILPENSQAGNTDFYVLKQNATTLSQSLMFADVSATRVGINTSSPSETLHVSGDMLVENTNGSFITDIQNTEGPTCRLSGDSSGISRIGVSAPSVGAVSLGVRGPSALSPGFGKQGDGFIYSSNANNGLNLISSPGTGTDDYIRFYAGTIATSTPDIHIQGIGVTRGYVGIGTETPTEKLDINGKTRTTNFQMTDGASSGYLLQSDASGNATWVVPGGAGVTGSGTTNYVPRWIATDTLSSTSSIYDNGSRVGIGTNTPNTLSKLHINNSDTASSTYGNYITVNGSNSSKVGQFIVLSNTTSADKGIIISFGPGNQRKVGVDVGGGVTVADSDVGYQYNSTTSAMGQNYGAYFRITATSSQNTILFGTITGGTNSQHQILRSSISGSSYTTTYGFRHTDTSTSTTKYGQNISISGNGLSTTNYGSFLQVSGANSTQYGYYAQLSGTYSFFNYGSFIISSLGSNGAIGSYIQLTGTSSGTYYGQRIIIGSGVGSNSYNNFGSDISNNGLGGFNVGLVSKSTNGTLGNIGVWGVAGDIAYTVGDIGVYGGVTNNNLTSFESKAGYFFSRSRSSSQYGVSVDVASSTYSTSSSGLYIVISGTYGTRQGIFVDGGSTDDNLKGITINRGSSTFNESGENYDFRIEGDTDQNLFFVDASTDSIGVRTNSPGADFEVNGFTKLGSDAPAIKTKLIELTTPASGSSSGISVHGITGTIIGYSIVCKAVDNKLIKPFDTTTAASNYTAYVTTTSVSYGFTDFTTNSNVANSPLRFYITYIE